MKSFHDENHGSFGIHTPILQYQFIINTNTMRKEIAAANWKMNCTLQQAETLIDDLMAQEHHLNAHCIVVLGIPYPYLMIAQERLHGLDGFYVAAQNMHHEESGAFTGEISAGMLHSIGVDYVILGHSERREYFGETNQMIARKIDLAIQYELSPIFCCGEPLAIREAGTQNEYVAKQLEESLFHLAPSQIKGMAIAYEPVWAIGTGKTATEEQAQEMHLHLRGVIGAKYGNEVANSISILYGGSVKASNAKSLFSQHDVDGGLVGGASLVAADFGSIIDALKKDPTL